MRFYTLPQSLISGFFSPVIMLTCHTANFSLYLLPERLIHHWRQGSKCLTYWDLINSNLTNRVGITNPGFIAGDDFLALELYWLPLVVPCFLRPCPFSSIPRMGCFCSESLDFLKKSQKPHKKTDMAATMRKAADTMARITWCTTVKDEKNKIVFKLKDNKDW